MHDQDSMPATALGSSPGAPMVERARALAFSQALRILLQRQRFYVPLTGTYLLPQLYERMRALGDHSIHLNTLRAYLRGETLPSDSKVRLLADALGIHRGVLLYAAGYLTPEDLPHYPGPNATLANLEADMREVEALPLAPPTKQRILHDLRTTARIVHLVAAERAANAYAAEPLEREQLVEQLITLWECDVPPPPPLTSSEETALRAAEAAAEPSPAPVAQPAPAQPAPVAQPARPAAVPTRSTPR